MSRKNIPIEQLATYLTSEIQKVEDCENLLIRSVTRLKCPDASGCNWSDDLMVNTGGVPESYFRPYLLQIVSRARVKFNLIDD